MNVLIIEHDALAFEKLKHILLNINPDIRIVGNTHTVTQTIEWFESNPAPDLIFMDIHLPDGLSFSIFHSMEIDTPIIITTAYEKYAVKAFQVNSIDYLLKPVEREEVRRALGKFNKMITWQRLISYFSQPARTTTPHYADIMLIPVNDKLLPIRLLDIACFYTNNEKTQILLVDGKSLYFNKSLDIIVQNLDPRMFFRANKQFIIARNAVENITIWFDSRLLLTLSVDTPERVYVSKNRAAEFKKWMVG
ncbi:MAG: LytTR family DNA-binding domain-containing protein [Tannerellaceae bacterium]|jgi:DNA-binding LytR/AlgR family response regulator|nr:LytTR family DNA-binding domain-containing protein [Tannerellaceae bacterium]